MIDKTQSTMRMRFLGTTHDLNTVQYKDHWFDMLWALYNRPGRYYHGIGHVADLLHRADRVDSLVAVERFRIESAIWFHDAVYCVPSFGNERKSADLARTYFKGLSMLETGTDVENMVLRTVHDGSLGVNFRTRVLLDLDLAGLADDWASFSEQCANIRKEYALYPETEYRKGRAAFMRGLLARPRIYQEFTELEAPARANIERHVAELEQS